LGLFGPPNKPTDRLKAMMIRLINRTLEEDISYSIENPAPSCLWAGATTREWLESKSLRPGQVLRWTNDMGVKGLRPSRRGSGGDKLSNQRWIDKRLPVGHQASVIIPSFFTPEEFAEIAAETIHPVDKLRTLEDY